MIYLFLLIILIIQIIVYDLKGVKANKKVNFYLILFILILISGLRYRIGLDTIRYMSHFENMPTIFNVSLNDFQESQFDPN
jgi:hypothetical protein